MLNKTNKDTAPRKRTPKQRGPQFERSPESFPALTIFPAGWDMSEIPNEPEMKTADSLPVPSSRNHTGIERNKNG